MGKMCLNQMSSLVGLIWLLWLKAVVLPLGTLLAESTHHHKSFCYDIFFLIFFDAISGTISALISLYSSAMYTTQSFYLHTPQNTAELLTQLAKVERKETNFSKSVVMLSRWKGPIQLQREALLGRLVRHLFWKK